MCNREIQCAYAFQTWVADITIAVRMEPDNRQILDYYLIPAIDVENPQIRLTENNHFSLDAYRFDDLEPFFMLAERAALPEAA